MCKEEKDIEHFHYRKDNNSYRTNCKECHKIRCKKRWKNRTEEQIEKDSKRYMNIPPNIRLWRLAKIRASEKELKFDLNPEDILVPEYCPVFPAIKLDSSCLHNCPSLDRIDNSQGYTKTNVQVISHRANSIKGFATAEELYRVADYVSGLLFVGGSKPS